MLARMSGIKQISELACVPMFKCQVVAQAFTRLAKVKL